MFNSVVGALDGVVSVGALRGAREAVGPDGEPRCEQILISAA